MSRWVLVFGGFLACAFVSPASLLAAPTVAQVSVEIDASRESATVRTTYSVVVDDPNIATVPLVALHFGGAAIRDVRFATRDGQMLNSTVRAGEVASNIEVALPANLQIGQPIELVGEYVVDRPGAPAEPAARRIVVPMLAPRWAPAPTAGNLFQAALVLGPGLTFVDGFPSTPSSVEQSGQQSTLRYSMPAVPSVISANVALGVAPLVTFQRVLDVLVVLALAAAGVATVYLMRALGRRPAAPQARRV